LHYITKFKVFLQAKPKEIPTDPPIGRSRKKTRESKREQLAKEKRKIEQHLIYFNYF
jgi:hypothetical protein